jgi:hypothetical protein
VDYHAARAAGYQWVQVRMSDGIDPDRSAAEHVARARAAGLAVGGYHFFIPWRPVADQACAYYLAATEAGLHAGDLLPWLDVETWQGASGRHVASPSWSPIAQELAEIIADEHGGCLVYGCVSDWALMGRPAWYSEQRIVAADYSRPAGQPRAPGGGAWDIHQHRVAPLPGICEQPIDQCVARHLARIPLTMWTPYD